MTLLGSPAPSPWSAHGESVDRDPRRTDGAGRFPLPSGVGSIPNTDGLGLESAGVDLDAAGHIVVDRVSRTSARGCMPPATAPASSCSPRWPPCRVGSRCGTRSATPWRPGPEVRLGERVHRPGDRHRWLDTARRSTPGEIEASAEMLLLSGNARAKMQGSRDGFVKLFCRPGTGIVTAAWSWRLERAS